MHAGASRDADAHPAAALRDPKYKRPIWDDIQLIKREYVKA
jgi:hypothetical protein